MIGWARIWTGIGLTGRVSLDVWIGRARYRRGPGSTGRGIAAAGLTGRVSPRPD